VHLGDMAQQNNVCDHCLKEKERENMELLKKKKTFEKYNLNPQDINLTRHESRNK